MQQCVKAGLPVNGVAFINEVLTPKAGNHEGYYEMYGEPEAGQIQKVWPAQLSQVDPENITALLVLDRRDKKALFASMQRQAQRENMNYPVEQAYEEISQTLRDYLKKTGVSFKQVYTEELNDRIDEVLAYLAPEFRSAQYRIP
ncbi:MAG TPA: hypothetical protein ENJ07_01890 [Gammaproteobacteria bacterium]|nr:hypothetical protein [Gammaproteobacteria bacterium]